MIFENIIRKYQDIFFYKVLELNLSKFSSVLDIGCGPNSPIGKIRGNFFSEGIDIHRPSIVESKKRKIHKKYSVGDIRKLDKFYENKSFECVIALDVIEHLSNKDALTLIKNMENIAKKRVIILTPNGFYRQDRLGNNPYQEHRSGWSKNKLKKLDYKVYGLRGLRYLRGEYATIEYRPWYFWGFIVFLSEPLLYFTPELSYHLFAVKDL